MKRNVDHGLGRFGGQSLPPVRTGKPIVDRGASVVGFKLQTKPSDHATATPQVGYRFQSLTIRSATKRSACGRANGCGINAR